MKQADLIVGQKYMPIDKTSGLHWNESPVIREMLEKGQDFLFYTGCRDNESLGFNPEYNNRIAGDYFNPEDVIENVEIGDFVRIHDAGECYPNYDKMFEKLNFKDKRTNSFKERLGAIGKVFAINRHSHATKKPLFGVEFDNGNQILIGYKGFEVIKHSKGNKMKAEDLIIGVWGLAQMC
jgi:hypothetical protein